MTKLQDNQNPGPSGHQIIPVYKIIDFSKIDDDVEKHVVFVKGFSIPIVQLRVTFCHNMAKVWCTGMWTLNTFKLYSVCLYGKQSKSTPVLELKNRLEAVTTIFIQVLGHPSQKYWGLDSMDPNRWRKITSFAAMTVSRYYKKGGTDWLIPIYECTSNFS